MASEGRNAGPSDQPAVEVRPEMTSQQSQTFKSYGQDYQFAETWANPPPEFVVSTGVANNDQNPGLLEEAHHNNGGNGGAANLASIGGSFKTKESQHTADEQPEVIWVPPSDKPWYKKIAKLWWMIGGISTLGIIAVILAILGALGMLDSHHNKSVVLHTNDPYPSGTSTSLTSTSTPPESTASATSSIEPSSLSTGTSTLPAASPTSTNLAKQCTDTSTFIEHLAWMGTEVGGYEATYDAASSSKECCNRCFNGDPGCAGWMYDGANKFTPCTKVMVTKDEGNPNKQCPKGKAAATFFSQNPDKKVVGGIGPCSGESQIQH
ncbi:uncharacterized protein B0T23DRAFT_402862 [Neurospora hispaniola]|uniref:Uncharacterized protein n=1 Tax=Neurospora hispaniola TaxID=588809 RepID=A0AAJ0IDM6_9PEZI|nr:hypothetical protein B0T23DRAFT_402862 [Neurospora hispaniola]